MTPVGQILKQIGSLWWTNVLLLLLAMAMGVATAFESTTTTELAQIHYYHTNWFQGLLALLGVNAAASLIVHWPWTQRNIGYVMTHGSLLIVLSGAAVTRFTAFDGSVGLAEGNTANTVYDRHVTELAITDLSTGDEAKHTVPGALLNTLRPLDLSAGPQVSLGDLTLRAIQYSPDAEVQQIFVPIDNPAAPAAAELAYSQAGQSETAWISAGRLMTLSGQTLMLRREQDADAFAALLSGQVAKPTESAKLLVAVEGETLEVPLPEVDALPLAIGNSGLTVQVTARYAQAIVGEGGKITEGPGTQSNPAVEVVLRRGDDESKRMVFANFPDFSHHADALDDVSVRYQAGATPLSSADLTLIAGPEGQLALQTPGGAVQKLALHQPITLTGGGQLSVTTWLPHAQPSRGVRTRETLRKNRMPALALKLTSGDAQTTQWLRRNDATTLQFAGKPYRIEFRNRQQSLPFDVQLEKFEIGLYPGGMAPRSYSSRVKITNHWDNLTRIATISMNAPVVHHGYTFFQSSYDIDNGQRVSYLSVARDPGRPIVYVGYVGLVLGMGWVLSTRMRGSKPAGGAA